MCGVGRVKEGSARDREKERERVCVCERERARERFVSLGKLWLLNFL